MIVLSEKSLFLGKVVPTVKKGTEQIINWLSITLLFGIFVLGVAQIVRRWILGNPIVWSEELIQLTYVWICYLGWVIAERKDSHIRITAVSNMLPTNAQKWLQVFNHILCILFAALMVYYGIKLFGIGLKRTAVSMPWLNFATVYVMGPICNAIIICYELASLVECITKGPRDYHDVGGDE